MNKQFCDYNISLKLKKLKFNIPCFKFWNANKELENFDSNSLDEKKINSYLPNVDDFLYEDSQEIIELCTAPTLESAAKWFRDIHKIFIDITINNAINIAYYFNITYVLNNSVYSTHCISLGYLDFNTYEQALQEGIKQTIEIVKNRKSEGK